MTSPQRNENIGSIRCWTPGCGYQAALRRDSGRRLYYVCPGCGLVRAPGDVAQEAMNDHASVWGAGGTPPASTPTWIAESWPWNKLLRRLYRDALQPWGEDAPAAAPEPAAQPAPEPAAQPASEPAPEPAPEPDPEPDPEPAPAPAAAEAAPGRTPATPPADGEGAPGRVPPPPDDEPEGDDDEPPGFWNG